MKKLILFTALILFSCSSDEGEIDPPGVEAYQITLSEACQTGELVKYCTTKAEYDRIWEESKAFVGPSSCHRASIKTTSGTTVTGYVRGMQMGNTVCQ